jgi:hypothetical protein
MTLEVDLNNRAPAALLKSTVERASAVSAWGNNHEKCSLSKIR